MGAEQHDHVERAAAVGDAPGAGGTAVVDPCCPPPVLELSRSGSMSVFRVEELDCPTEENDLRSVLTPLAGVRSLEFDLVARQVRVRHDLPTPEPIEAAIRALGMRPRLVEALAGGSPEGRALSRRTLVVSAFAGLLAIGSEVVVIAGAPERSVLVAAMAIAAIGLGGRDTLRKGFQALRSRRLTMNLLMSVAVVGAPT